MIYLCYDIVFYLKKADQFNSTIMKDKTINFIVDNFNSVVLSESFPELLKNSELVLEVLRTYASKTVKNNLNNSVIS